MARVFFLIYMYVHSWQDGNGGTLAYHFGQVIHALKTAKQLLKDELLAQPQNLQGQPAQARPACLSDTNFFECGVLNKIIRKTPYFGTKSLLKHFRMALA